MTREEAFYFRASICYALGQRSTWARSVSRLGGGGSMDGPAYQCAVRAQESRDLSTALCVPVEEEVGTGEWLPQAQGEGDSVSLQRQLALWWRLVVR